MKKTLLALLLSAPLLLAACGETTPSVSSSKEEEKTSEASKGIKYTATIKQSNGEAMSGVKAQWCIGDTCLNPVACDANGYAEMYSDKTGPFNVHAMEYDEAKFAYNPYAYIATPENPDVTIVMTDVEYGDQSLTTNTEDTALAVKDAAYRITLNQDEVYYISLSTTSVAHYSIESWQNDINTAMKIEYTGTKDGMAKDCTTSENNNFKYEFDSEADSQEYTFKITLIKNPYKKTTKESSYTFPFAVVKK